MVNLIDRLSRTSAHALLAGVVILASAGSSLAAPGVLEGRDARVNVDNLTRQVQWFSSLRDAEDSARQKGKPVLWVHMLGKIDGAT